MVRPTADAPSVGVPTICHGESRVRRARNRGLDCDESSIVRSFSASPWNYPTSGDREAKWLTGGETNIATPSNSLRATSLTGLRTPRTRHPENEGHRLLSPDHSSKSISIRRLPPASRSGKSRYSRTIARSSGYTSGSPAAQVRCSAASCLPSTTARSRWRPVTCGSTS